MWKEIDRVRKFYGMENEFQHRITLSTEGFTGKLITHDFKKIARLLSPYADDEKVLDIGSGWGYLSWFIPDHVKFHALDISLNALGFLSSSSVRAERLLSDASTTPFQDDVFDKIFCINLITHLPSMKKGLNEIYRIMKPGGLCVVNFTNRFGLSNVHRTVFKMRAGYYARHNLFVPIDGSCSFNEAKKLLCQTGFEIIGTYGWGISIPYQLGQKAPNLANKVITYIIKTQDSFPIKQFSNALIFKVRKSV